MMNPLLLLPLMVFQLAFPATEVLSLMESGKLVFTENAAEVPSGLKQQIGDGLHAPFDLQDEWTNTPLSRAAAPARVLIFYAYDPGTRNCLLYYQRHDNAYILVYGKYRKSTGDYSLEAVQFSEAVAKGDKSVNGLIQRIEKEVYEACDDF